MDNVKPADLITAHWKVLIPLVAMIIIQTVDKETLDWVALVLGTFGTYLKQNNPDAKRRLYNRPPNEDGRITVEQALAYGFLIVAVGVFIALVL